MTPEDVSARMLEHGYIADEALCVTLSLTRRLARPLLVEGEAGVGKTAIASALAHCLGARVVRLQCYEGLDANNAVYEWNYAHQLLAIKLHETEGAGASAPDLFSERFLLERPLLEAVRSAGSSVLLIDEVDRADEAFEAFLLEMLSEFQISIPELGTITAVSPPPVVVTSNGTRELSDALRRRCLYHYLDYPDPAKERLIVETRLPGIETRLANEIVELVQKLRRRELVKPPGVAETLDWAAALAGMGVRSLLDDPTVVLKTRACLLKTREDLGELDETSLMPLLASDA